MVIKTGLCAFSQQKIYPGHGKLFIKVQDSKTYTFVSAKSASSYHQRWNPRKMAWTQLYRRMHKKGGVGDALKKTRKRKGGVKAKPISGASVEELKKKRDQSAAARATVRAKALREAKAKKAGKKSSSKPKIQGAKQQFARPSKNANKKR